MFAWLARALSGVCMCAWGSRQPLYGVMAGLAPGVGKYEDRKSIAEERCSALTVRRGV